MLNSSYFLCALFKAWPETSCTVARSLCGPQLLLTRHFRQCLSACSLVNLPIKTLLLPSLVPLLLCISHFTSLLRCGARAVGSPICHQPPSLPDPPAGHMATSLAPVGDAVPLLSVQVRGPGLTTFRARNFLSKRADVFHIVISFHGEGRT